MPQKQLRKNIQHLLFKWTELDCTGTNSDHYCFNTLKFINRADAASDLVVLFTGRTASHVDCFLFAIAIPSDDCMQLVKVCYGGLFDMSVCIC